MSNLALTWAFNQNTKKSTAKLILIKLADQANDEGRCWPSIRWICKHTELSERSVQNGLRWLEQFGFIDTIFRYDKENEINLTNVYRLKIDETMLGGGRANSAPVGQPLPQGRAGRAPGVGQDVHPNPKVKPSIKPTASSMKDTLPEWVDKDSWSEWVQHRHEIRKPLTPLSAKKCLALLSDYRDRQKEIINNSIVNGWQGLWAPKSAKSSFNKEMFAGAL